MVANAFAEHDQNAIFNDMSPYQSFDGGSISDSEFAGESDLIDFSDAKGKKRNRKKKSGSTIKSRMAARQKARAERKDRKLKIKEEGSATQKTFAETMGQDDPATQKLLESLSADDTKKPTTIMSKGLKIGLIVGGVLIIGIITFVVIRKMKNKT